MFLSCCTLPFDDITLAWIKATKHRLLLAKARKGHCHNTLKKTISLNPQSLMNDMFYHEGANECPNDDIQGMVEIIADPRKGDPEGHAQQDRLYLE